MLELPGGRGDFPHCGCKPPCNTWRRSLGDRCAQLLKSCATCHVTLAILSRDKVAQNSCRTKLQVWHRSKASAWELQQTLNHYSLKREHMLLNTIIQVIRFKKPRSFCVLWHPEDVTFEIHATVHGGISEMLGESRMFSDNRDPSKLHPSSCSFPILTVTRAPLIEPDQQQTNLRLSIEHFISLQHDHSDFSLSETSQTSASNSLVLHKAQQNVWSEELLKDPYKATGCNLEKPGKYTCLINVSSDDKQHVVHCRCSNVFYVGKTILNKIVYLTLFQKISDKQVSEHHHDLIRHCLILIPFASITVQRLIPVMSSYDPQVQTTVLSTKWTVSNPNSSLRCALFLLSLQMHMSIWSYLSWVNHSLSTTVDLVTLCWWSTMNSVTSSSFQQLWSYDLITGQKQSKPQIEKLVV